MASLDAIGMMALDTKLHYNYKVIKMYSSEDPFIHKDISSLALGS